MDDKGRTVEAQGGASKFRGAAFVCVNYKEENKAESPLLCFQLKPYVLCFVEQDDGDDFDDIGNQIAVP